MRPGAMRAARDDMRDVEEALKDVEMGARLARIALRCPDRRVARERLALVLEGALERLRPPRRQQSPPALRVL